jgi:hypothetical protein
MNAVFIVTSAGPPGQHQCWHLLGVDDRRFQTDDGATLLLAAVVVPDCRNGWTHSNSLRPPCYPSFVVAIVPATTTTTAYASNLQRRCDNAVFWLPLDVNQSKTAHRILKWVQAVGSIEFVPAAAPVGAAVAAATIVIVVAFIIFIFFVIVIIIFLVN